mgnify:CR=1 FL=1
MPVRSLPVACLVALLAPVGAHAGSAAGTGVASAQVRVEVNIAPVVQVLQNRFPDVPDTAAPGPRTASQQLVVSTNLRRGFCLNLHADGQTPGGWRLRSVGDEPVQVDAVGNGWRVCGHRQGLHTLQLEHEFDAPVDSARPVRTELTLL